MKIALSQLMDGVEDALELLKQSEDPVSFDRSNGAMFPFSSTQSKWKFAKSDKHLRLHDGTNVYHFDFPEGEQETPFRSTRGKDPQSIEFEQGAVSKGSAQIHRSDPGSIYFTLQEGYKNPTYTFKHTGGDNWQVFPKQRKHKFTEDKNTNHITEFNQEAVKQGMEVCLKEAGINQGIGDAFTSGLNGLQKLVTAPGRNWETPWMGMSHGLGAAALGAGAGGLYHLIRRHGYNTLDENVAEDEPGNHTLLKRMLIPGAAMGITSAIQGNMAPNAYGHVRTGNGALNLPAPPK